MAKNEETKNITEEQQAQIDAYFEKMLEKARAQIKAEAAEILGNAKKQVENKTAPVDPNGEMEVVYTFFKDDDQHSDDIFINVNGERIVCQRGVPVKLKKKFLDTYLLAEAQKKAAADVVSKNEKYYETRRNASGI